MVQSKTALMRKVWSKMSERGQRRQRNQRGEGARLREELIEAAMRILDRSPATVLSLRMVAREAGVAAPSVYAHFSDAQHLTTEIVRECWRQLGDEMVAAGETLGQEPPRSLLRAQMSAYVRYAMERPSRYQLLFAMQPSDANEANAIPGLVQPAFRKVRDALRAILKAEGMPSSDNGFTLALRLLSLVHGRIALAQLAPWRKGNDTEGVEAFAIEALDAIVPPKA
jgi:AcrR family transcriptional regulator